MSSENSNNAQPGVELAVHGQLCHASSNRSTEAGAIAHWNVEQFRETAACPQSLESPFRRRFIRELLRELSG
jgi:hypothetical protein